MRLLRLLGFVLLVSCQGELIDPDLPGTNQPPTTNAALAFRFGGVAAELISDLVSDPAGNLYVTGSFTGTPDFDPGEGITAIPSLGGADGFLAKYSPAGALLWVARIGGPGAESVTSLARDAAGDLLVGGGFEGSPDFDPGAGIQSLTSAGGEDGFVARFSSDGALRWARRFGGVNADEVGDLAVDLSGNLYAVGHFAGQANGLPASGLAIVADGSAADGFLISLDPAGSFRWALPMGGNQEDAATAIAVTSSGSLTVAGHFRGSADFARNGTPVRLAAVGGADLFLASYSATGVLQLVKSIGGLADETVTPGGLALDPLDRIALLGSFSGSVDFDPGPALASKTGLGAADLFLARYDVGYNYLSSVTLGAQGSVSGARALADQDGSVLLTGAFSGSLDFDPEAGTSALASLGLNGATDAFVARYSLAGGFVWVARFGESTTLSARSNSGVGLARDLAGNLLVAGRFFGSPDFDPGSSALRLTSLGEADAFVVKLTPAGALATTP